MQRPRGKNQDRAFEVAKEGQCGWSTKTGERVGQGEPQETGRGPMMGIWKDM